MIEEFKTLDQHNLDPLLRLGVIKKKINLILDIDHTLLHAIGGYTLKR